MTTDPMDMKDDDNRAADTRARLEGGSQQQPRLEVVSELPTPYQPRIATGWYPRWGKRVFDVAIVLLLSPIWLPLYLLITVALLFLQGHPIHYAADRPGRDGRLFPFIKFRTMNPGAALALPELLALRPDLAEEFGRYHKLHDDPRRTKVGAFLRRTSLDEIPQIFCVLKGDMSLVGPRPPWTEDEYDTFYGNLAPFILQHRPGLTGLWQVSRREPIPYERKVWLDMIYASKCSLWLDIKILAKSIPAVLRGDGAY